MDRKKLIWIGMGVGSTVGGFIPSLWTSSAISFSSIIFSAIGGVVGIWIMFKLT
jgi:uncharacterized membrane protein YeaQ/YmgE (transglycosylase-associated protein family)